MMGSRYGHTWQTQHGTMPEGFAAAEWGGTLAGLSRDQILQGMETDRIRAGKWPPSSTEFLGMCYRVPELSTIKLELLGRNTTRTPFGYLVWTFIDAYQFKQANVDKANGMIRDAYDLARSHIIGGGEMPFPADTMLEHSKPERRAGSYDKSLAYAEMAKCRAMLGIKENTP